jgi:acylphosphatase
VSDARIHVLVSGRVQGVFFRDTIRRGAEEHGVAGWVANRADGTVEAVFEGARVDVEAMVDLVREGPRGATVEGVEAAREEPEGLTGFDVC